MSLTGIIDRNIDAMIIALGDLVKDVVIAEEIHTNPIPGVNYRPDYKFHTGKGVFEKVEIKDYPQTQIMIGDQTLLLMKCHHDVAMHEFVKVGNLSYHVHGVKPDMVGTRRILQKLLVRVEPKEIEWESVDPLVP